MLVRVSLELVEQHGVEEFSLREAASRCGVVVSAAYKHFAAKDALLSAVSDEGFGMLAARMVKRVRRASGNLEGTARAEAALVELGRTYILFAIEHPRLFRLMYGPAPTKEGGVVAAEPRSHQLSVMLVQAITDVLGAYGRPATKLEAHKVIAWALVHGFAVMVVDGLWAKPGARALEEMIDELGAAVLRSLR